jgi:hypothetical protein
MKKLDVVIFLIILSISLYGQDANLVYMDGWVDIQSSGETFEAFIGESLRSGDSIITQSASYAELEQKNLSSIFVKPDTIFTIREIETDSGRETVLSTTIGAVSFKFGKFFGKEPMIASPGMVAGVRGTEFTVYAGEDGSTLVSVDSGLVTVESQGVSVDLAQDEGVEVPAGKAPGDKFSLLGRTLDFSTWNSEKYNSLMDNPISGLDGLGRQMDDFLYQISDFENTLDILNIEKEKIQKEWKEIGEKEGNDKAGVFYKENLLPVEKNTGRLYLNIRYYSLSALSFRRFILGRLYLDMKSKYIMDPLNPEYTGFLKVYNEITGRFEETGTPFININDL